MRSRNSSFPYLIGTLFACLPILLYLTSQTRLEEAKDDKGTGQNRDVIDVKYVQFFSVRPSQLVYLDKTGYRLALDSTDEIAYIEAKSGLVDKPSLESPEAANGSTNYAIARSTNDSLLNAYDEREAKNDAERDESIDYNMEWAEFPEEPKIPACDSKHPKKNVVLLKTHRTGGGTLANLLYRYGDLNDLQFALPKQRSYDFYWPFHFNPSFVDKRYMNSSLPNFLINARYSPEAMAFFMPKDSYYIAMIRNPMRHFESVFNGYQIDTLLGIQNSSDPFDRFLSQPRQHILQYLQKERRLDINLNMAKNGQMFDLGLQHKSYNNKEMIRKHVDTLAEKIDLVLIMEYFDESLVLLKRELCWDLDDVVYFKLNQRSQDYRQTTITENQQMQIKDWNDADVALYDFFNNTFWTKIGKQDSTFFKEVEQLRRKVRDLEEECVHSFQTNVETGELEIKLYGEIPNSNKYLCEKMTMKEESYILYLKKKFSVKFGEHTNYLKQLFLNKMNSSTVRQSNRYAYRTI